MLHAKFFTALVVAACTAASALADEVSTRPATMKSEKQWTLGTLSAKAIVNWVSNDGRAASVVDSIPNVKPAKKEQYLVNLGNGSLTPFLSKMRDGMPATAQVNAHETSASCKYYACFIGQPSIVGVASIPGGAPAKISEAGHFSWFGDTLLIYGRGNTPVSIYDPATRRATSLANITGRVHATDRNGKYFVAFENDTKAQLGLFDNGGKKIADLQAYYEKVVFSPDGKLLAARANTGKVDQPITVLETATGKELWSVPGENLADGITNGGYVVHQEINGADLMVCFYDKQGARTVVAENITSWFVAGDSVFVVKVVDGKTTLQKFAEPKK